MIYPSQEDILKMMHAAGAVSADNKDGTVTIVTPNRRLRCYASDFAEARHRWRRYQRRQLIESGVLPGSSTLPFTVELGDDMVKIKPTNPEPCDDIDVLYEGDWHGVPVPALARAIAETVTGHHEIWFEPETGEARISVETDHERVMLVLALEGGR